MRAPDGSSHAASMGPSRECDGDEVCDRCGRPRGNQLQWGRRVNATETFGGFTAERPA